MNTLNDTLWIELRKAARSKLPLFTTLAFFILPLVCALLMVIYKYPDFSRGLGLVSVKANLAGGSADWPFYLNMFTQGAAIGGFMLFSMILSWMFGREFSDGTLKDMLAVPVARGAILAAKFAVAALWFAAQIALLYLTALALGAWIGLPLGTPELFGRASAGVVITAGLVVLSGLPVALFASAGRGYLAPMGISILILALSNVIALLGWGDYFPWAIPALYAASGALEAGSVWVILLTGLAGAAGTYLWWMYADQNK